MTLRLGQSSTDAVVNAGPAVFISTSGPNPIVVQPLPFQPGTSFGTTGTGSGTSFSVGSGLRPRNIDIRIRTGSVMSSAVNQREGNGLATDQPPPPPPSNNENTNQEASRTRVVPIPIRISTLPHGLAPDESSRSSMGIVYPVLAGTQTVVDSNGQVSSNGENNGLDHLLRNLFPGEHIHNHGNNNNNEFIFQGTSGGTSNVESASNPQTAVSSNETSTVTDQGTFLSNLLHQILPVVSQHINQTNSSSAQPSLVFFFVF